MNDDFLLKASKTDSLKKRYFFKLSANIVSFGIAIGTQAMIPRGLGPRLYGNFNFINSFFVQIMSFLDAGTSTCFYTKLSQRLKEFKLVTFYSYIGAVVCVAAALFVIICTVTPVHFRLWPDQKMIFIYMGLFLGILVWCAQIINQAIDAYGLTVNAELAKIFQKVLALSIVLFMFLFNGMNLRNFFFYCYAMQIFLIVVFLKILINKFGAAVWFSRLSAAETQSYAKEFFTYSHPLVLYSLVGVIAAVFDRWLLQFFGGSIQQGFYSLSVNIGTVCFLFTSAMTPLIMREFSIAYGNKDMASMASIFRRHIPLLYSLTAFLVCFIAVNADKVTLIMGGGKFKGAILPVTIMAFFPLHQTYGQLSNSVFFAAGRTALYRNIGIFFMILGLPVTYLLIAPHKYFGLEAGSTGLAVKMVAMQFVGVNVQLFFNARFLKITFWKYLSHQIVSAASLLGLAVACKYLVKIIFGSQVNILISFLLCGLLYLAMCAIAVYSAPILFGINRKDIHNAFNSVRGRIAKLAK